MARTNGPIQVWSRSDTVPTDAQGGYGGGDTTAAAVVQARDAAMAAAAGVDGLATTTTTAPAGTPATVTVTGDMPSKVLNFTIPRGETGLTGAPGRDGMGYTQGQALVAEARDASAAAQGSQAAAEGAELAKYATQDTGTAALVTNPNSSTSDALGLATIGPSTMGIAQGVLGRNTSTPMPDMVGLITAAPDETLRAAANQTRTSRPSPTSPTGTVWHVAGAGGTALTWDKDVTANAYPANAVTTWIYLPDPSVIDRVNIEIRCAGGIWNRNSTDSGSSVAGKTLKRGWNIIRITSLANPAYVHFGQITRVIVRAYYSTPTAEAMLGPVVIEQRPKASVVIINDWGAKQFLLNGYPSLKDNGIPAVFALRPDRLGTGTYPDDQMTVADSLMVAKENNNSVSFHSWNGEANSGYTAEECRDMTLRAQAALNALGLFSESAVHRPAWVQNAAPNAYGAFPYLATGATWNSGSNTTCWPPFDRLNIPRIGIHGRPDAFFDDVFTQLEATRGAALFYTHGVVPAADAGSNHASQETWDYFVSKITTGIAAGWLEGVTVEQLTDRERLILPDEPPG